MTFKIDTPNDRMLKALIFPQCRKNALHFFLLNFDSFPGAFKPTPKQDDHHSNAQQSSSPPLFSA
jgi:hypothetical protein